MKQCAARDVSSEAKMGRSLGKAAQVVVLAGLFCVLSMNVSPGQSVPAITGDLRVDELLSKMTLAEELTLIHDSRESPTTYQGQAGYIAGVARLGIAGMRLADGPPGVLTRRRSQAETATMGMAATFDVRLAEQNGLVIGREARALGIDVALQPFVNLDRDPTFKRAYNTFGEDPLLTSEMGAAEVRGIQSQQVMAMAKHFIGYDTAATDVWIDEQTLHEVYAAPFAAAIKAGALAVMCSYNHVNGEYACGNRAILRRLLRDELGYRGFVTSDWGATHSALFLNAGLDMEMIDGPDSSGYQEPAFLGAKAASSMAPVGSVGEGQGDLYGGQIPEERSAAPADSSDVGAKVQPKTIAEALEDGSVTEATVKRAAGNVLLAMERFGLLDRSMRHDVPAQSIDANAAVIEKTGEEAAVLLRNEGEALPLKADKLDSVVLIGPTAAQVDAIGISGERSMGFPERQVGPLAALRQLSGNQTVRFAVDDDMTGTPIPVDLLSHDGKAGLLRREESGSRIDAQVNFTVQGGSALPPNTKASWNGMLTIAKTGVYWIYLQALGTDARLTIDGRRVAVTGTFVGDVHGDILQANQDNALPTVDGLDNVRRAVELTGGIHTIMLEISPDTSNAPVQVRLNWYTPESRAADHAAAIEAARHAKTAVVFVWARRAPAFVLPGAQDALVEEIAAVNPNTIVVLNTSQPVAMPWVDRVKSILQMWWPGDEGGWATAKVLLGQTSPAGRLPMTWAKRIEDYPATDPRFPERSSAGVNGRTTFSEGVNVGYRWFDREGTEPLFAFGSGLSYTRFGYSRLKVVPSGDGGLNVRLHLRNLGKVGSDEVPQVYLERPQRVPAGVQFPVRSLAAFVRIHLAAGEEKAVALHIPLRQLQFWSTTRRGWVRTTGRRGISVGASSRDLRLRMLMEVPAVRVGRVRVASGRR